MQSFDLVLRMITAGILGAFIGFERKAHLKDAGLRTHFILAIGSALIMIVSKYGFSDMYGISSVGFDPSRIAAQVVSGIGFLGAGMIIFRRNAVLGLTTATGLWATAGVGLAVGAGLYLVAIAGTGLVLIGLTTLKSLERRFIGRIRSVLVIATDRKGLVTDLDTILADGGFKVEKMSITHEEEESRVKIESVIRTTNKNASVDTLRRALVEIPGVQRVEIPDAFV